MIDDHDETDAPPAKCKSCGVPFIEHLGLQGACARLENALSTLKVIRTWAEVDGRLDPKHVVKLCDEALSFTKRSNHV